MSQIPSRWGLYLHIPFCSEICHYCDFAKTARWDESTTGAYFQALSRHISQWIEGVVIPQRVRFTSLYLGGGTPGLFTREYEPIFALIRPYLEAAAEVTLEANPTNLSRESLQAWKELGCTRLSVGVQSFDAAGLRFLTRDHDPQALAATLGLLPEFFSDYNLDLIYSWPGQSLASWKEDLRQIVALEPTHVSLYNLTYAPKTPIGRAHERNKLQAPPDDTQAEFYRVAQGYLADKGYLQEEVSNWHRPGFPARHNSLYWQDEPYIGVGSGACGYLPSTLESPWGLRYQYPAGLQRFPTMGLPPFEEGRDAEAWLLEYVGASLRSCYGVDLEKVREKTGRTWKPTPWVQESLSNGLMSLDEGAQRLYFSPPEWFRETAWCHEVLGCLR